MTKGCRSLSKPHLPSRHTHRELIPSDTRGGTESLLYISLCSALFSNLIISVSKHSKRVPSRYSSTHRASPLLCFISVIVRGGGSDDVGCNYSQIIHAISRTQKMKFGPHAGVATHILIKSRKKEKDTDGRMMAVNKASSWMFTRKNDKS